MKVTGIIAEYNPFHQGHAYHLARARELTGADRLLVVMGGNFMQRGEPAIVDKYARAEMALKNGADLVLELPAAAATGSAEYFAEGAVELLDASGVVDALCFGSELGKLAPLERAAALLLEEPEEYRQLLREELKRGKNFPEAREIALSAFFPERELLSAPNNILAIEYLKALKRRKSSIEAVTIPRLGNYHGNDSGQVPQGTDSSESVSSGAAPALKTSSLRFASASEIRRQLYALEELLQKSPGQPGSWQSLMADLADELPPSSFALLKQTLLAAHFVRAEDFALPLHYRLMKAKDSLEFAAYLDVSEELSRRIYSLRQDLPPGMPLWTLSVPDSTPEAGFQEPCSIFSSISVRRWHGFPKNSGSWAFAGRLPIFSRKSRKKAGCLSSPRQPAIRNVPKKSGSLLSIISGSPTTNFPDNLSFFSS